MNPYASFLGDRNSLEVIEQTPSNLSGLAVQLVPASMEWRPAPGKWNAREIICHLADSEIAFAFRLRQTLAEDQHVIQPFDQERWAGMYGGLRARAALNAFSALREWNLALIGSTPAEAMSMLPGMAGMPGLRGKGSSHTASIKDKFKKRKR